MSADKESERLRSARAGAAPWRRWGPYLSERQWGTVREDYSDNGDAWNYFTHDQARSRAYRWGEDGLAGFCDDQQRLCFALALWNGADPILKERLFGLTNGEGNHGEDVKEYYFYLDSTPTHSYLKYLYKYPQRAYPYDDLVRTNRARRPRRAGIRAARHGRLRRRPLLRRVRRVREGVARGHPDPDHRVQPRAAGRDAARAAHVLVSQHLERRRTATSRRCCARSPRARTGSVHRRRSCAARRAIHLQRGCGRAAVHRERDQYATHREYAESHAVRQGRHQRLHRARSQRGRESAALRHQGGGALLDRRGGRASRTSCGCDCAIKRRRSSPRRMADRSATASAPCSRRAGARPMSSTRA